MIRPLLLTLALLCVGCTIPVRIVTPPVSVKPKRTLPTCWDTVDKWRYSLADVPPNRCIAWFASTDGGYCNAYELGNRNCSEWKNERW